MKAIAVFMLFLGMFLIVQGYYKQANNSVNQNVAPKVIYVPRSLYEEQLSDDPNLMVSNQFKSMFEDTNITSMDFTAAN
jgi:hypothetical protein